MRFANPQKKSRNIASLFGHSIDYPGRVDANPNFKAGDGMEVKGGLVFVHTPPQMAKEAIAAGLVPEDDMPEDAAPSTAQRPVDVEAFKEAVHDAFEALVKRGEREDFAGTGMPKPEAVEKLTGWPVQNGELRDLWTSFQVESKD